MIRLSLGNKRFKDPWWSVVFQVMLIVCAALQLILGPVNLYWASDACNRFLYYMNYVIWALIMLSLMGNLVDNFLLLSFYGCFFLFLMGQKIFMPHYNRFLTFALTTLDTQQYAVFAMIMAVGIITPYYSTQLFRYFSRKSNKVKPERLPERFTCMTPRFVKLLWLCFFLSLPFSLYCQLKIALVRAMYQYTDGYLVNVYVPAVIKVIDYLFPTFAMLLLAGRLPKRQVYFVLGVTFFLEGVIPMIQGLRSSFAIAFLFVFWYLLKYYNVEHLKARYIVITIVSGIGIVFLFWVVGSLRSREEIQMSGLFNVIKEFMISTGGSDSLIANTIVQRDALPGPGISYILDPVIHNPLTVILTGKGGMIQGRQYIEHFRSLSHWISYLTESSLYCAGYGMGSSYLAEAYVALGIPGVFICSAILGKIIAMLSDMKFQKNVFHSAFVFLMIHNLFTLPRSDFFGWFTSFVYFLFGAGLCYVISRL